MTRARTVPWLPQLTSGPAPALGDLGPLEDAPAADRVLVLPIHTVSEANTRGGWAARHRRAKSQRGLAALLLRNRFGRPPAAPLLITLTRLAPRRLDSDNAVGACKAVRDGIADWLGVDDGSPLLTWVYGQRATATVGVEVRVEAWREGAT